MTGENIEKVKYLSQVRCLRLLPSRSMRSFRRRRNSKSQSKVIHIASTFRSIRRTLKGVMQKLKKIVDVVDIYTF